MALGSRQLLPPLLNCRRSEKMIRYFELRGRVDQKSCDAIRICLDFIMFYGNEDEHKVS